MYVMTAGAAAVRRLQGGGASAVPGGLPGANAGMAAAARSEGGMFAAKEYSKVRVGQLWGEPPVLLRPLCSRLCSCLGAVHMSPSS